MPRKDPDYRYCILITTRCNAKCPDCTYEHILDHKDLDAGLLKREILPHISEFHEINLAGGEPTIHPKFWEIVEAIASANPKGIQIITNARSFTGSLKDANNFLARLDNIASKTNASIRLRPSVGDPYAASLKGGQRDLSRRVARLREAYSARKPKFQLSFMAVRMPGQTAPEVISRYGLPRDSFMAIWQTGKFKQHGTQSGVYINPHGEVYEKEDFMVSGQPKLGTLGRERLSEILSRRTRRF